MSPVAKPRGKPRGMGEEERENKSPDLGPQLGGGDEGIREGRDGICSTLHCALDIEFTSRTQDPCQVCTLAWKANGSNLGLIASIVLINVTFHYIKHHVVRTRENTF